MLPQFCYSLKCPLSNCCSLGTGALQVEQESGIGGLLQWGRGYWKKIIPYLECGDHFYKTVIDIWYEPQYLHPNLNGFLFFQNCQTFNSLSCLSTTVDDCFQQNQFSPGISSIKSWKTTSLCTLDVMPGRTPACTPVPEPQSNAEECKSSKEDDFSYEESEYCATEDESSRKEEENASWRNSGTGGDNVCHLDGELDIEQIENNWEHKMDDLSASKVFRCGKISQMLM